ncbi:hypothetical protein [Candidatus Enterovibrio escicola]|uniref:hypothetical protein n=1 Tax=Candidatus Enterovibrio escicola TaxID=1927127 RepID=UPI001314B9C2|nr:hypothetical protein [Candidatus Enterovibrio escacola]
MLATTRLFDVRSVNSSTGFCQYTASVSCSFYYCQALNTLRDQYHALGFDRYI